MSQIGAAREHFGTGGLFPFFSLDRPVSASLDLKNVVASFHHSCPTRNALSALFGGADCIVVSRRMPSSPGGDSATDVEAEFGVAGMSEDRRDV